MREYDGFRVIVDDGTLAYIRGVEIDFVDGGNGDARFVFNNLQPEGGSGCGTCGSHLFWDPAEGDALSIFAGSLDGATGLTLSGHIFCADKGDYYEIGGNLPCADQDDPTLTTQVEP